MKKISVPIVVIVAVVVLVAAALIWYFTVGRDASPTAEDATQIVSTHDAEADCLQALEQYNDDHEGYGGAEVRCATSESVTGSGDDWYLVLK